MTAFLFFSWAKLCQGLCLHWPLFLTEQVQCELWTEGQADLGGRNLLVERALDRSEFMEEVTTLTLSFLIYKLGRRMPTPLGCWENEQAVYFQQMVRRD